MVVRVHCIIGTCTAHIKLTNCGDHGKKKIFFAVIAHACPNLQL